jgi:NAD(P)-dependent dehydrogenase (short-subunit alcohol dehydrogenase family)
MSFNPMTGEVAVVTGASRGIGRLLAVHLAGRGAAVGAIARPSADLDSLRQEAASGQMLRLAADVTSPEEVSSAFGTVTELLGTPTLVVTCAGTAETLGPAWAAEPRAWWHAVAVDLLGTLITAGTAVRLMLPVGSGRIVTVYGNLGDRRPGNVSAFAVAKAGIARLAESLACELEGTGIRVFAMHPGFVRTPMTEMLAWSEPGRTWLPEFGQGAQKRWGDGRPAAELLEAIASGAADELAGRVLWAGDDLATLAARHASDPDFRRLRLIRDA